MTIAPAMIVGIYELPTRLGDIILSLLICYIIGSSVAVTQDALTCLNFINKLRHEPFLSYVNITAAK